MRALSETERQSPAPRQIPALRGYAASGRSSARRRCKRYTTCLLCVGWVAFRSNAGLLIVHFSQPTNSLLPFGDQLSGVRSEVARWSLLLAYPTNLDRLFGHIFPEFKRTIQSGIEHVENRVQMILEPLPFRIREKRDALLASAASS